MSRNTFQQLDTLHGEAAALFNRQPAFASVLQDALHTEFPHLDPTLDCHQVLITEHPDAAQHSLYHYLGQHFAGVPVPVFDKGTAQVFKLDDEGQAVALKGIDVLGIERFIERFKRNVLTLYQNALTDHWAQQASANSLALASLRKRMLRAELQLRIQDDTLDTTAQSLLEQVIRRPAWVQRLPLAASQRAVVRTLALQVENGQANEPLCLGFSVCSDSEKNATTVLYTVLHGIEVFDSLKALDTTLTERLNRSPHRETLLRFGHVQHLKPATPGSTLQLAQPTEEGSVFRSWADALLAKQSADVRHAYQRAIKDGSSETLSLLARQLDSAAQLQSLLATEGIAATRHRALWLKGLPTWVKSATRPQQEEWRAALREYRQTLTASSDPALTSIAAYGKLPVIHHHAREALQKGIKAHQHVLLDPDKIILTTTSAFRSGAMTWTGSLPANSYIAGASRRHTGPTLTLQANQRSLTQLVLENLGLVDSDFWLTARLSDPQGNTLTQLTPNQVRAHVRGLDFAHYYDRLLQDKLLDSSQAKWRKERFVADLKAGIKLDTLEAHMAGELSALGLGWVKSSIDNSTGVSVVCHQLQVRGHALRDVLVFKERGDKCVLYTPQAGALPRFSEYANVQAVADALGAADWHDYLLERLPNSAQAKTLKALQAQDKGLFETQPISGDFFEAQYQLVVQRVRDDARALSTSTAEVVVRDIKTSLLTILDVVSTVLPMKILLPLTLGRALWSVVKFSQSVHEGDRSAALAHFLEAISQLTDASSDLAGGSLGKAPKANSGLDHRLSVSARPKGLVLRTEGDYAGVYERAHTDGRHNDYFIQSDNRFYQAKRQPHTDGWHVINPRNPSGSVGQGVLRDARGQWQAGTFDRLPGGNDDVIQGIVERYRVRDVNLDQVVPYSDGTYQVDNRFYIVQPPLVFAVTRNKFGNLRIISAGQPPNLLDRPLRRQPDGTWQIYVATGSQPWRPLHDRNVHFDWQDANSIDEFKDRDTLRALKIISPNQGKQGVERLLKSFNMGAADRRRLAADVRRLGAVPQWALQHRARSMTHDNPQRFTELGQIVGNILHALRRRAGYEPSPPERAAIFNYSQDFLEAFVIHYGYAFNDHHSLTRTDVPGVFRGDTHAPAELANDGALMATPGSHFEQYTTQSPIPASVNRRDAQSYADELSEDNLAYNSQTSEHPSRRPDTASDDEGPWDADSPRRLDQRHGFLYLLDTRGLETVGIADNYVLNGRAALINGGVVSSEVHVSVGPDGIPETRVWLVHTSLPKAVRIDDLYQRFGRELQSLQDRTQEGGWTRGDHDILIDRMPPGQVINVDVSADGLLLGNPFAGRTIPQS